MSKMKRLTIPMGDNAKNNLVLQALVTLHAALGGVDEENDEVGYMRHDLLGLQGVFGGKYKVMIEISQDDFDGFVGNHGVDYPAWSNMEIVDVIPTPEVSVDVENNIEPRFMHLAYIEDGELTFALKSNCLFPGFENMGDADEDDDMKFTSYKTAQRGEAIFHEGTTYGALPTDRGWVIVVDGEIDEELNVEN